MVAAAYRAGTVLKPSFDMVLKPSLWSMGVVPLLLVCVAAAAGVGHATAMQGQSIPTFIPWDVTDIQEQRYILQVVVSAIPHICKCNIVVKDRNQSVAAISSLASAPRPMILVAVGGVTAAEQAAMAQHREHTRRKLIVIHLSDEFLTHNLSWYPDVKAVFRNYHVQLADLADQADYLVRSLQAFRHGSGTTNHGSGTTNLGSGALGKPMVTVPRVVAEHNKHVFWIPLGFSDALIPAPVMYQDLRRRPLLWSYKGSLDKHPERQEMFDVFKVPPLVGLGNGNIQDSPLTDIDHSLWLYQSKVVPMPPGSTNEQWRLWEALATGAVPMALRQHAYDGLAHVALLGFRLLWVESWAEGGAVVADLAGNLTRQAEVAGYQAHNLAAYKRVMHSVASQFASVVCNTSK